MIMKTIIFIFLAIPVITGAQKNEERFVSFAGEGLADVQLYTLGNGNGYLIAGNLGGPSGGALVARLNKNLDVQWSKTYSSKEYHSIYSSAFSRDRSVVYLAANARNVKDGQNGGVIYAVDTAGTILWKKYLHAGQNYNLVYDVHIDHSGNLVVFGLEEVINSDGRYMVVKLRASDGKVLNSKRFFNTIFWAASSLGPDDELIIYGQDTQGKIVTNTIDKNLKVILAHEISFPQDFRRTGLVTSLSDGRHVAVAQSNDSFFLCVIGNETEPLYRGEILPGKSPSQIMTDADENIYVSAYMQDGQPAVFVFDKKLKYQKTIVFTPDQVGPVEITGVQNNCGGGYLFSGVANNKGPLVLYLNATNMKEEESCGIKIVQSEVKDYGSIKKSFYQSFESGYSVETRDYDIAVNNQSFSESVLCEIPISFDIDLGNDTIVCAHAPVNLDAGSGFQNYKWSTGSTSQSIVVIKPGTYWVQVTDQCGWKASDTITIDQYPETKVDFSFTPDQPLPYDKITFYSMVEDARHYWWQAKDVDSAPGKDFVVTFYESGQYPVTHSIVDDHNCLYQKTDTLVLDLQTCYVPNAFSPDGNGINDYFAPTGLGIEKYHIQIFNRWGQLVFDGHTPWDGKHALPGVYTYVLTYENDLGHRRWRKGNITLLK